MTHDVNAETRHAGNDVRKVGAVFFLEPRECGSRHDLLQRLLHELGRQDLGPQVVQFAIQTNARRIARDEVQVRAALAQHFLEKLIDAPRDVLLGACGRRGGLVCAHFSLMVRGARGLGLG